MKPTDQRGQTRELRRKQLVANLAGKSTIKSYLRFNLLWVEQNFSGSVVDKNRIHYWVEEKESFWRDTFTHKYVPPEHTELLATITTTVNGTKVGDGDRGHSLQLLFTI